MGMNSSSYGRRPDSIKYNNVTIRASTSSRQSNWRTAGRGEGPYCLLSDNRIISLACVRACLFRIPNGLVEPNPTQLQFEPLPPSIHGRLIWILRTCPLWTPWLVDQGLYMRKSASAHVAGMAPRQESTIGLRT